MGKKMMLWKTKGMNQDLSVSAFNPEFSFENMNLRLSTNEGNTLMSWVNERGTESVKTIVSDTEVQLFLDGIAIGSAVLNNKLIVFTTSNYSENKNPWETTDDEEAADHIYKLEWADKDELKMNCDTLFLGNLNFSALHPLETLVSYESEDIQKVYWVDGRNQPRVINIAAAASVTGGSGVYSGFDFVPTIEYNGDATVTKDVSASGLFAPGVIQYCFAYFNKYGQQSNIVWVSPLNYISHPDRGASPEDKVSTSFKIDIAQADSNFQFVRLYSIQRTSWNLEPIVKILDDIPIGTYQGGTVIERTVTTADDSSDTLPVEDEHKIRTVSFGDGVDWSVTINNVVSGTSENGYSASSGFKFVGYREEEGHVDTTDLVSLQTVLNNVAAGEVEYADSYVCSDCYGGINASQQLEPYLTTLANGQGYIEWKLQIGNTFVNIDLYNKYIIYDYKSQKWYITSTTPSSTIGSGTTASASVTYTDTGTTGAIIDPAELLFIGGKEITALTIADKDNTLFLGNITQVNASVDNIQKYFDATRSTSRIEYNADKVLDVKTPSGIYTHTNTLKNNQWEITTFKGGETYRFGFQLQKADGEWSEPIFIEDKLNTVYPSTAVSGTMSLVTATGSIPTSNTGTNAFSFSGYKKIRPLIVFPSIGDRTVLCQGVLNPTVFNPFDRIDNSPFAQASWYFRPISSNNEPNPGTVTPGATIASLGIPSGNPDLSIAPAELEGKTREVYVLVARVMNSSLQSILERGSLKYNDHDLAINSHGYTEGDQWKSGEWSFEGVIANPVNDYENLVIFIDSFKFPEEYNRGPVTNSDGSISDQSITYEGITFIGITNRTFPLYQELNNTEGRYFYTSPAGVSGNYVFKFYTSDNNYYTVTFTPQAINAYVVNSLAGNTVPYKHYESLFTWDDLSGEKDISAAIKRLEIQNAKKIYGSVGDTNNPKDRSKSNSQFFIDQNIVTLNSPDIEFDTQIQTYATDNLKLRIVGYVPVTASVSSHAIDISSNMLELSHNLNGSTKYGRGELNGNVWYPHSNIAYSAKRLVADYLWNDAFVVKDSSKEDKVISKAEAADFVIHPWHKTGSLNNDTRGKDEGLSWLKTKKEANLLFSSNSIYGASKDYASGLAIQFCLTENAFIKNYRLKQGDFDINYYPNIDKVLYNESYRVHSNYLGEKDVIVNNPVSMKYLSTSHAIVSLGVNKALPNTLSASINGNTFWNRSVHFSSDSISVTPGFDYLWLAEIYKDSPNIFGGDTPAAVSNNKWLVAGEAKDITNSNTVTLNWVCGDTYYQRYDCLKTYAFTPEDTNQIVEILSFMCETHTNIDGRYDRNRGQIDNTNMRPQIFNLLNPVYNQQDNFFTYRKLNSGNRLSDIYPNQIIWSKTKNSTADVDVWTNVTLANPLELDGDKGKLNKLTRFNDQLLAFQDTGISQILYNENTAISSTAGVPIEIANSGKVTGKRYLSDTIGCKNKWSMVNTPTGIYFMDDHDKSIYLFNGQLENLSTKFGFNSWCKKEMTGDVWRYIFTNDFKGYKGFRGCYDKQNQEVLFLNNDRALAFSEKIGAFTSFYDYYNDGNLCNLEGEGIWLKGAAVEHPVEGDDSTYTFETSLWGHQKGSYGRFFGENKPYWMTLVGNPEPQVDKMFTNLEFRACVDGEMVETQSQQTESSEFLLPFDFLECWDEYQHGYAELKDKNGHEAMMHHISDGAAALKRKFRIWRCDIPRDNCAIDSDYSTDSDYSRDSDLGVYRTKVRPLDRIRNTWVYLKLMKKAETGANTLPRTEVHDMGLGYF